MQESKIRNLKGQHLRLSIVLKSCMMCVCMKICEVSCCHQILLMNGDNDRFLTFRLDC